MVDVEDLKIWLHRDLPQREKLMLILSSFDSACQVADMKARAREAGFPIPSRWNPSSTLQRTKGFAVRTPMGWELTESGKQHLRNQGVAGVDSSRLQVATELRCALDTLETADIREFVAEAIGAYEFGLHRSAIVMSWIGAVALLHHHVYTNCLTGFNSEARRLNPRWKDAISIDDLSRMRESDFLDRLVALSVISRDVKNELRQCLDRRNSCGHPNSLQIRTNTVAHHIEVLLFNVFRRFNTQL